MAKRRIGDRNGEVAGPRWLRAGALARVVEDAARTGEKGHRAAIRISLEQTALELSGEVGYSQMGVADLVERADSNLGRLYKSYGGKFECYLAGYRWAIDALSGRLLLVGGEEDDWPAGMRAALVELAAFVVAEPNLAKGIFVEVYVAGGAAREKRNEVFERLSRAIDRARRETDQSRHSPPPITSRFILSGIEAALLRSLSGQGGADFESLVPGLLHLAISSYFDHEVAQRELRRLG
jgi:AcrR family transcriptional regulator